MLKLILNAVFLLAYLLSALVQFNDPDPAKWVLIYAAAALMCCAAHRQYTGRGTLPRWLPLSLLAISLVWATTLLPDIVGAVSWSEIVESVSMRTRAVEEAREIGGLALIAVWSAKLSLERPGRRTTPSA